MPDEQAIRENIKYFLKRADDIDSVTNIFNSIYDQYKSASIKEKHDICFDIVCSLLRINDIAYITKNMNTDIRSAIRGTDIYPYIESALEEPVSCFVFPEMKTKLLMLNNELSEYNSGKNFYMLIKDLDACPPFVLSSDSTYIDEVETGQFQHPDYSSLLYFRGDSNFNESVVINTSRLNQDAFHFESVNHRHCMILIEVNERDPIDKVDWQTMTEFKDYVYDLLRDNWLVYLRSHADNLIWANQYEA